MGINIGDTVTISKEKYYDLLVARQTLLMLEGGGVDNWNWYCESLWPGEDEGGGETIDDYKKGLRMKMFGEVLEIEDGM